MKWSVLRVALAAIIVAVAAGCESNSSIVNHVEEREANEIVVFLASKGIEAQKVVAPVAEGAAGTPSSLFNIMVAENQSTEAMSLLNRYGLPRKRGTTLLELFAKSGLMSSDREETIRYQAGLAEELKNTILKIDGVLDADVQISFPPAEAAALPGAPQPKITAAVYVKHQGILEDPNSHAESKIKRLVAGSVNGLSFEDVAVISDRSRFADIVLNAQGEPIGPAKLQQTHVSVWNIVMTKSSLARFRLLFFGLILLNLILAAGLAFMVYRFLPQLQKRWSRSSPSAEPVGGEEPPAG